MYCCALSLLLGLLFIPGHCVFPPGSCDSYTNITEPWHNYLFTSTSFTGFPMTTDRLWYGKWVRFTGIGGDKVVTECPGINKAGVYYPIRIAFPHPEEESLTETTGKARYHFTGCDSHTLSMSIVLCPGGFYIYKYASFPSSYLGFATYHNTCLADSCGPLAECSGNGGCQCISGYEIPTNHKPEGDSYGCVDIDECEANTKLCGVKSVCTNIPASFVCSCAIGFQTADPALAPNETYPCEDIDECEKNPCGAGGDCLNNEGSFTCECHKGYLLDLVATPLCQDIDECFNSTICGPDCICTNKPGTYECTCEVGYRATNPEEDPSELNICIDIDECVEQPVICGPKANCTNNIGSYTCVCLHGYRITDAKLIASDDNPCIDIDECIEQPGICGLQTVCTNRPGTFYCSCPDGFFPSTGIDWTVGVSYCKNVQKILDEIEPLEGQTKEEAFLGDLDDELKVNSEILIPDATVVNSFAASMEVSGFGPLARSSKVSSEGDGRTGNAILGISDRLVVSMVMPGQNKTKRNVKGTVVDLSLDVMEPGSNLAPISSLQANDNSMDIDLGGLAQNNNGSAAVAFLTLKGMDSLLSKQYYKSENKTEMYSEVVTAILPLMNNTNLTEPVNFTIRHKKPLPEGAFVNCVYWEENKGGTGKSGAKAQDMRWSLSGCSVLNVTTNYTKCSCSHLSTFALIMQIGNPPPDNAFLDWLNRTCVIIGLFFFALAILTFLLCSWNPKINNTARLNLCINLALSHLLLLWNEDYVDNDLACTVMAGLIHFLVIASFVWMQLEALQLYLLVRNLSKVQVIQRDGLPRWLLYLIGYAVPFVVVGVSAVVYSDGYGATDAKVCWLSTRRNFNWALTGPVIAVLALNWILFCATLWSLRPTLANMKSDVSQSKDTRLIVFKILAQFVILGCTWILGLYQTNLFFQVLFIILNSQQGTFLFIVHCVLNKEVREEYIRWLTFSCRKDRTEQRDAPSVSEEWDRTEDQGNEDKKNG